LRRSEGAPSGHTYTFGSMMCLIAHALFFQT